jgi:serine/threonine protein kinase
MGEIYLAEDIQLGRNVALKFLTEEISQAPDLVRRFNREARAASALSHPNILTIHEIGEEGGRHYIVTEVVDSGSLRDRLSGAPMNLSDALDIAIQAASALEAAHAAGILHRDIRPDNILLRHDRVKLADFGLAKLTEHRFEDETSKEAATQSGPGVVLGSTAYMSPEQVKGESVDARTDLWSLGAVLYEMVTGHQPFEGRTPA